VLAIPEHGGPLFGVAINPDGSLLATGGFDNLARIWKLDLSSERATAELVHTLKGHGEAPPVGGLFPGLTSVVFSPDGMKLATGGADGMAKIWDAGTGQELVSVQAHPDRLGITRLAFSPDGILLATVSDGTEPGLNSLAKIWDVETGEEISTFTGHIETDFIWGLAFSPDGERVATGSVNTLKIWEAKTGRELLDLVGHTYLVVGADFSPDGKYLATSSTDDTAKIWDLSTGETLRTYTSPYGDLYDITFTPDGKRFIVTGLQYVYGYVFDFDELMRFAQTRLTRWFTLEECRNYLHQDECPPPP
jgi:WD40 repeat protein